MATWDELTGSTGGVSPIQTAVTSNTTPVTGPGISTIANPLSVHWDLDDAESYQGWLGTSVGMYSLMASAGNFGDYRTLVNEWGQTALDKFNNPDFGTLNGSTRMIGTSLGGFNVPIYGGAVGEMAAYSGDQLSGLTSPGRYGEASAPTLDIAPMISTLRKLGYTATPEELKKYGSYEGWAYWTLRNNHITPDQFYGATTDVLEDQIRRASGEGGLSGFLNNLTRPEVAIPLILSWGAQLATGALGSYQSWLGNSTTAGPAEGALSGIFGGIGNATTGTLLDVAGATGGVFSGAVPDEELGVGDDLPGSTTTGGTTTGGGTQTDGGTTGNVFGEPGIINGPRTPLDLDTLLGGAGNDTTGGDTSSDDDEDVETGGIGEGDDFGLVDIDTHITSRPPFVGETLEDLQDFINDEFETVEDAQDWLTFNITGGGTEVPDSIFDQLIENFPAIAGDFVEGATTLMSNINISNDLDEMAEAYRDATQFKPYDVFSGLGSATFNTQAGTATGSLNPTFQAYSNVLNRFGVDIGRELNAFNTEGFATRELDLMRRMRQEREQQQRNSFMDLLQSTGQMGTTGGANLFGNFMRSQEEIDLQEQLKAIAGGREEQNRLFDLFNTTVSNRAALERMPLDQLSLGAQIGKYGSDVNLQAFTPLLTTAWRRANTEEDFWGDLATGAGNATTSIIRAIMNSNASPFSATPSAWPSNVLI